LSPTPTDPSRATEAADGPRIDNAYPFDDRLRATVVQHLEGFESRRCEPAADQVAAAVAICIVPDERGEACFVLTRRASSLRSHAGQWALPGGRSGREETAADAARRETAEEVGLSLAATEVLATLDDYPTRSGYVVTPVVLWSDQRSQLKPNAGEVESIHLVPLAELDHADAPRLISIPESNRPVIQMPLMGHWIHAPTAAILLQLREVALHGRNTRVDHFDQPTWAWR
jgi:8-oxo-dGTP pyrophosphatase MutT (NUDIX family)